MIQIPANLTPTQARVYESFVKWNDHYFTTSPLLTEEKDKKMKRDLQVARAFHNELRTDIGLPPLEYNDGQTA